MAQKTLRETAEYWADAAKLTGITRKNFIDNFIKKGIECGSADK